MQLFCYFFDKEVMDMVVLETNRFAVNSNINTQFHVSVDDLYHYIGILIYMSIYRYPNLESYWGRNAFTPISRTMTFKRFEAIKRFLSFRDENERVRKGNRGYDPLFRMRKLKIAN